MVRLRRGRPGDPAGRDGPEIKRVLGRIDQALSPPRCIPRVGKRQEKEPISIVVFGDYLTQSVFDYNRRITTIEYVNASGEQDCQVSERLLAAERIARTTLRLPPRLFKNVTKEHQTASRSRKAIVKDATTGIPHCSVDHVPTVLYEGQHLTIYAPAPKDVPDVEKILVQALKAIAAQPPDSPQVRATITIILWLRRRREQPFTMHELKSCIVNYDGHNKFNHNIDDQLKWIDQRCQKVSNISDVIDCTTDILRNPKGHEYPIIQESSCFEDDIETRNKKRRNIYKRKNGNPCFNCSLLGPECASMHSNPLYKSKPAAERRQAYDPSTNARIQSIPTISQTNRDRLTQGSSGVNPRSGRTRPSMARIPEDRLASHSPVSSGRLPDRFGSSHPPADAPADVCPASTASFAPAGSANRPPLHPNRPSLRSANQRAHGSTQQHSPNLRPAPSAPGRSNVDTSCQEFMSTSEHDWMEISSFGLRPDQDLCLSDVPSSSRPQSGSDHRDDRARASRQLSGSAEPSAREGVSGGPSTSGQTTSVRNARTASYNDGTPRTPRQFRIHTDRQPANATSSGGPTRAHPGRRPTGTGAASTVSSSSQHTRNPGGSRGAEAESHASRPQSRSAGDPAACGASGVVDGSSIRSRANLRARSPTRCAGATSSHASPQRYTKNDPVRQRATERKASPTIPPTNDVPQGSTTGSGSATRERPGRGDDTARETEGRSGGTAPKRSGRRDAVGREATSGSGGAPSDRPGWRHTGPNPGFPQTPPALPPVSSSSSSSTSASPSRRRR